MYLSASEMRERGLYLAKAALSISDKVNETNFRKLYGSSSGVVALIWYDLHWTDISEARLVNKEETGENGLHMFLAAMYFL